MHPGVGRLLLESEIRGGVVSAAATRRAAFVIAGGHVLTAAHCSADATQTDPLWLRLPSPDDGFATVDLPVRVVDEDTALDVAVLGPDPARTARGGTPEAPAAGFLDRVTPVPVGLPAGAGESIRTEGYPRDGRAGGLAFTGKVVDPAAQLPRSRVHALQLQIEELAASVPHGPGGHSGGPVLTAEAGLVVGVVRAYPPDETRDYAVGGTLLATRIQDLAARFPAVREAFSSRAAEVLGQAAAAVRAAPSLATLIRADARHTEFFGRELELGQLRDWCTTGTARAAMLLTGPAGQGKTRLARHFCEQLTATGEWVAAPLRGVGSDGEITDGLRLAALAKRPLLLAVDYAAEYGATALLALVDRLCAHGPPRWRLLLIARHTGDWWNGGSTTAVVAGLRAADTEVDEKPLRLAELVAAGDDRQRAYEFILGELRKPVTTFAEQHRLIVRADPPAPPLQRPEYGSALMLHIAAVCALLPDAGPGTGPTSQLDPTKVIDRFLDLERDHHWLYRDTENLHRATTEAFGDLAVGEAGRYRVETAVTAATLTGAANHVQACTLATTALGVETQQAEPIAYWLRDLYPPPTETPTSSILHPLQPDLLGEELVTRVLRRQRDHGESQDRLLPFALVSTCSEAQTQRMLTVLIRTADRHAWIADLLTSPDDEKPTSDHNGLLSRIPVSTDLGAVENALPRQNTHLLQVAAQLTQRLLDRLDHIHGTGNTVAVDVIVERARLLSNLAVRLAEVGQRDQALCPAQEAVKIRQQLVETSAAYLPNLAMSLNNLAIHLSNAGQRDQALYPAKEAVDIHRRLVKTDAAYLPNLAMSLDSLAVRLAEVGQLEQALKFAQEAVDIRQQLVETAAAYLPKLAGSLNTLANRLAEVGQLEQALKFAQEAVDIRRQLVETAPAAYLPDLAASLNNLAIRLAEVGQLEQAPKFAQEAVDIRQQLVKTAPAAYLPDLANSLNNLAIRLAEMGRHDEARVAEEEAARARQQCA